MLASRNKAQNEQFNDGVINVLEAEDGIIKKIYLMRYLLETGHSESKDLWMQKYLGIR